MSRRRKKVPEGCFDLAVERLSHDGRGVGYHQEQTLFVPGCLPGEKIRFRYRRRFRDHAEGQLDELLLPSPLRVAARCPVADRCGGCSLQHLDPAAQIDFKRQGLEDALTRIGKVAPDRWLPPLTADAWGYRRKARLGVKYVQAKDSLLVGFREKGSAWVTEMTACPVLHPRVGEMIAPLREMISGLQIRDRLPQIEMAMGDGDRCALIFRVLDTPADADERRLRDFCARHAFDCWLQEAGPDSLRLLAGDDRPLDYRLPAHDIEVSFQPQDFTQVNAELNRRMVDQALGLLELRAEDRVLDLFCGVGNFTLPMARLAARVVGVEGDARLVARARDNARRNGLVEVEFFTGNLYQELAGEPWVHGSFNKALLDPPRSGAREVLPLLPQVGVSSLLYVSCYPATLARDADILVHSLGYRLKAAGVMDMFPHTGHVESMALFVRE